VKPPTALEPPAPSATNSRRRVRFGYFNPGAGEVYLVGSFNGWDPRATPLNRNSLGDWSIELELPTGEYPYRFFVDGEWRDDPTAQQTAQNPFGGFDAIMIAV
jgi:1,4-alpha-glucan branching enzyme